MSVASASAPDRRRAAPARVELEASGRRAAPAACGQRELILALLLLFCYGFFQHRPGWNEYSRYDLVRALVDDRTTRIDPYHENTGDKAFYEGHYYSDKPPGSALLAVPGYALTRAVAALAGVQPSSDEAAAQALAFDAAAVPTVVLALLLLRFLRAHVGERWALTITVGYALGTIAFPFATVYFGHAAATFFLFAAFYVLWRAGAGGRAAPFAGAGFLAGWAVLVDLAAAVGVGVLLLYALARDRRAPLLMAIGALPPALVLLAYNWASFGGPFNLGYAHLAHPRFAAGMGAGMLGVTGPRPEALEEILVGPRGLLRLSPWLALAPLGLWAARHAGWRREVAACGAICVAFLLVNAGYYLPLGGSTPGPRFLTPALPFAAALVALAPRACRPLTALLILPSLALTLVAVATVPNAPEAVRDPLVDLWLPRLLSGHLAETTAWLRWGLSGARPLAVLGLGAAIAAGALYATTRPPPVGRRLAAAGIGPLAILVAGFATPLDLGAGLGLGAPAPASDRDFAIVDAGVTVLPLRSGELIVTSWAQVENYGPAIEDTTVLFTVHGPSGEPAWADGFRDLRWAERERARLEIGWSPTELLPGDYRLSVAVVAAEAGPEPAQERVLASVEHAATFRVDP